jgi:hypothetical protein
VLDGEAAFPGDRVIQRLISEEGLPGDQQAVTRRHLALHADGDRVAAAAHEPLVNLEPSNGVPGMSSSTGAASGTASSWTVPSNAKARLVSVCRVIVSTQLPPAIWLSAAPALHRHRNHG